jgi:formylglycine-generating enzyme required for sulfatase activity
MRVAGGETGLEFKWETILGPSSPEAREVWMKQMTLWRDAERANVHFDGSQYDRPELKWAQASFIQAQMMVEDRYFFDPVAGKYTVDRYLDDLVARFGGIDSVLIWPVYPNIGIDNRNQHDLLADLPGGLVGVKAMVADFHRRGVRVLFPVMPWDVGTRDEGVPLWEAAARDMAYIGADGVNGDTMAGIPGGVRTASDRTGRPIVLEPEVGVSDDAELGWNQMSWGYWEYKHVPVVSRYKWLESRHMVNVCERWAHDRTDGIQSAFFNGAGYESWENIWGIWNQFTPRDAEALRRVAIVERATASYLTSPEWEPHVTVLQENVFASRFPRQGSTLWLLVNRGQSDLHGPQIEVPLQPAARYFDFWNGVELRPAVIGNKAVLSFDLEPIGYGAVLEIVDGRLPESFRMLMARMAALGGRKLGSYSNVWKPLPQTLVEIVATSRPAQPPEGMIRIPGGRFRFVVTGVEIEGGNDTGVDVQYPWEEDPRRTHDTILDLKTFYIERYPVTNADFKVFLDHSHYRPADAHNFLRDWRNGTFPAGWERKPVTWVSIEDARAYARWAGKRLPHEWEWQRAARGDDSRLEPWGTEGTAGARPDFETGRISGPPSDVDAHPAGASPYGVMDLMGNVWQWTDEYRDEHTRAAILVGGSHYRPTGSNWYFPRVDRLDQHGKYLLMYPGKDRAATIGFRCAMDSE